MKKTKIFTLPSHQSNERTSGVDYLRVIQPITYLNGYEEFETTVWTPDMDLQWPDIARDYDIIFLNYINNDWAFAAMGAMARHYGRKIVMDFDDALWNIKEDNTAYSVFKKGSEAIKNITAIAREVDHITTTNNYLKNIVIKNTDKSHTQITAIDNYIDLSKYSHISPFKDTHQVTITHFGSTSHFNDIAHPAFTRALDRLMSEYPNIVFHTVGSFFSEFKMKYGQRYEQSFGDVDIYKWISKKYSIIMDNTDIVVAPLVPDVYNQAKSGTKFLETSSCKKPGVYQNLHQYQKYITDGVNGHLASNEQDWYKALKTLIDDKEHRRQIGENAYKTVLDNQIQDHISKYASMFRLVLDKK